MTVTPPSSTTTQMKVNLGQRSYDIITGYDLKAKLADVIMQRFTPTQAIIITDDNVGGLYGEDVRSTLSASGFSATQIITVKSGEQAKSFSVYKDVCEQVLSFQPERGDLIIALGGGVVGDLAGFVASTVYRGVKFIQIPTTLLAQVDSAVGGKTAINTKYGKNLIGTFYQPHLVVSDVKYLNSLSERHFNTGYAEILKYSLINNPAFFDWLETNLSAIRINKSLLIKAIKTSCQAKAKIVAADELETGDQRVLLNLGHTFAHALEAATDYSDRLYHGEAVAIGLCLAHRLSARLKLISHNDVIRVENHCRQANLPTKISDIAGSPLANATIINHITHDKKRDKGQVSFILSKGIGKAFVSRDVDECLVTEFLTMENKY